MEMTLLIAQAYGCGAYGTQNYNSCEADAADNSNTSPESLGAGDVTPSNSQAEETSGSTSNPSSPETSTTVTQTTRKAENTAEQLAATNWNWLLPIILVLAILFALILLAFKRRHRKDDQNTNPPAIGF